MSTKAHIAIVGSGISGLTSAWLLRDVATVTVFEREADHFGGHTDTHQVSVADQDYAVDTGFIVFNRRNYPHFCHMIEALGVESQASDMSLAIDNRISGLSYNPSKGYSLLFRSRNLLKPKFWRLLKDLLRFYKQAKAIDIQTIKHEERIDDFLDAHAYSQIFRGEHLYPMCGALWSVSSADVGQLPLKFLLGFMQNHRMLELKDRPQWRTITDGSAQYVKALKKQLSDVNWVHGEVSDVQRSQDGVQITTSTDAQAQTFDAVIMACHGPQSLALLGDASDKERDILSAFQVSHNRMVLHTDKRLLPAQRNLWASWNVSVEADAHDVPQYGIHYWMNNLQNLTSDEPLVASLNPQQQPSADKVLITRNYSHPLYDAKTLTSQSRWDELRQDQRTFYAGAYWGWGFHEDGAASAFRAVRAVIEDLGLPAPNDDRFDVKTHGLSGAIC